ncbi:MAG TPA: HlyD family type I secretion periplasmic adaptor subunit [Thiolapillus brandeum]|uniref:Membrane fusion protein (MFP) family protein n=1 Tax=Thiolapillus brandeum TaxID=1076588 RepID=A0A7C5MYK9_9GAMM|nr:HlyD family type I secretion periplasmic adaptor subunit [Thiolapillus brandeum]
MPAPGTVVVESHRKVVAHLEGGIVREIRVHEGEWVERGDPLVVLDDAQVAPLVARLAAERRYLLAERARLEAERQGAETFDGGALPEAFGPGLVESQRRLFAARRAALRERLAQLDEEAATHQAEAESARGQLELLVQQLEGLSRLAKVGYAPEHDRLELDRRRLELESRMELALRRARNARLEAGQVKEERRQEVAAALAENMRVLARVEEELKAAQDRLRRLVVRAPVSGAVKGLAVHTVGGVVQAGEKLMELVPSDERLLGDARVPARLVDRVRVGQRARIQMESFVHLLQVVLEGRVVSLSADRMEGDEAGAQPYYLARLEIIPRSLERLGDDRLQPGMPATVFIETGERTLLQYLLSPLLRRLSLALGEA